MTVMTIVAISLLPFVLGYQIWSYYVFRKRVSGKGANDLLMDKRLLQS